MPDTLTRQRHRTAARSDVLAALHLAEVAAVGAGVGAVHLAIGALDKALCRLPDKVTGTQVDVTLELLRQVREARVHLAQLEAGLETRAGRSMPADTFERPDLFALRRRGSSRKQWDNERLEGRVRHEVAARLSLGDVDGPVYAIVAEGISAYQDTARPSWRVTKLKAAGVRFDDCCETVPGKLSVQVSDRPLTDDA